MFRPAAWSRLATRYAVERPHVQLTLVGSAQLGGIFGRIRSMLYVGSDAHGIVLHMTGQTVFIPWSHVRRGAAPTFPIRLHSTDTFLLGPEAIPLTLPAGCVPSPSGA